MALHFHKLCQNGFNLIQWFGVKSFVKVVFVFSQCCVFLFSIMDAFEEIISPKDAICLVWLELAHSS